jgi:hypothetical protein
VVAPRPIAAGLREAVFDLELFDPTPFLFGAGWSGSPIPPPARLPGDNSWARLQNTTGLIPGVTRLRDELFKLFSPLQLASTNVRALLDFVWDGTTFRAA